MYDGVPIQKRAGSSSNNEQLGSASKKAKSATHGESCGSATPHWWHYGDSHVFMNTSHITQSSPMSDL